MITLDELDRVREASTGALFAKRHLERKYGIDHPLTQAAYEIYEDIFEDATAAVLQWIQQGCRNP